MVKKLMKHELIALLRILVWFMLAILVFAGLARIAFETMGSGTDSEFLYVGVTIASVFSVLGWYLGVLALFYAATILSIVRFFKTLFTGEGYLTFSLPVTPMQLLLSKFLSALIATFACTLVCALSVLIALPSVAWEEFIPTIGGTFGVIFEAIASEPILIVEAVLLILALIPSGLLYSYLIACIGQLFTKARIFVTIVLYFVASSVIQYIGALFLLPMLIAVGESLMFMHLFIWVMIALIAVFDVVSFFVIRYILLRKVNLVV